MEEETFTSLDTDQTNILNDYEFFQNKPNIVRALCMDSIDYLRTSLSDDVLLLSSNLVKLYQLIPALSKLVNEIGQTCHKFDVSPDCKGNGYRSLLNLAVICVERIIVLLHQLKKERHSRLFRPRSYITEVSCLADTCTHLTLLLRFALVARSRADPVFSLFYKVDPALISLQREIEQVDRECFFGPCFAMQFNTGMRNALKVISIAMASYSDGTEFDNDAARLLVSLFGSGKYLLSRTMRIRRVVELSSSTNIKFCKAFWSLLENFGMQHVPLLVSSAVDLNMVFPIAVEPLSMQTPQGPVIICMPPELRHVTSIGVRLLSYRLRKGQNSLKDFTWVQGLKRQSESSRSLIFHCHGGGFVAQSSRSHEIYLRYWASELNVPIVSVDYSLAPEHPFPQAVWECFYTYCWALENAAKLGTSAECVCVVGDSAGGNLVTALCLLASEKGIRLPNGLVVAYPAFNLQVVPSPSRLMSVMDPLLPSGILQACLAGYMGHCLNDSGQEVISLDQATHPLGSIQTKLLAEEKKGCLSSISFQMPPVNGNPGGKDHLSDGDCPIRDRYTEELPRAPSSFTVRGLYKGLHAHNSFDTTNRCTSASWSKTATGSHCTEAASAGSTQSLDSDRDSPICFQANVQNHPSVFGYHSCPGLVGGQVLSKSCCCSRGHTRLASSCSEQDISDARSNYRYPPRDSNRDLFGWKKDSLVLGDEAVEASKWLRTNIDPLSVQLSDQWQQLLKAGQHYLASPLLAPENLLRSLPPVYVVACAYDPLLDDSVEFTRLLVRLRKRVELYIVDGLPHGFLQFQPVNADAQEAGDLLLACIKKVLHKPGTSRTTGAPKRLPSCPSFSHVPTA